MSGRHLAFPFRIAEDGRTAAPATVDEHVRDEIMQLLLTSPGERPFLPSFGGGLQRLVFEGASEVTAGLAKATISQALSRWLGHRVEVSMLDVKAEQSTLIVDIQYRVVETGEERVLSFQHS